ncbi:MAG: ROK family protein [Granulosicoccus sp.]|nr:ROK family protein [Granulosicoccus sp.]
MSANNDIKKSDDLRSENRVRVLKTLRRQGPCSPSKLNRLTGLSAASISTLTSQMIAQEILISEKQRLSVPASRGRPRSQIKFNAGFGFVIVLSLTIDLVRARRVDYAGNVCKSYELDLQTRKLNRTDLLSSVSNAVQMVMPVQADSVRHIGVCFQGITEHTTGKLCWSPILSEQNIPLGKHLHDMFQRPVSVNNDCYLIAEALSDRLFDAGHKSFATVLFSYGVGLSLHIDNRPFCGTKTSALEFGHWRFERDGALCRCGKLGCIEAYAADYGIERLATGSFIHDPPAGRVETTVTQQRAAEAHTGNRAAIEAFAVAGAAIGEGLANLFHLLDPIPVALVGRDEECFALMQGSMHSVLKKELRTDIDTESLFHFFADAEPLLEKGLIKHSLASVDAELASG